MSDIEGRKREHIDTVLNEDVSSKGLATGFENYHFEHVALPEIDLDAIDLTTTVLGKELAAPFLISSMTGGTDIARDINLRLAEAAQSLGIAMGVGSQRAGLESVDFADTYRVRQSAPDIFLFANLGAVQLNYGYTADHARQAVDMIEADALFLHLNPLQEAVQEGGDRHWTGLYDRIAGIVAALEVPVVAKEVGNGISGDVARRLIETGVAGIDVAGAGGTSWSEVEAYRQQDPGRRRVAHAFAGWGIPTAESLQSVVAEAADVPVFASGGIRSGVDAGKAVRLGASLVGMAAPTLGSALSSTEAVFENMKTTIEELRITMFCTGSSDLEALRSARIRVVPTGEML
ncbi:MAG: type 2 isopentenyl-diphosphate Delta-isomerase [Rhodospirillaceae bacterium]|nr:type 2 isopentenyl-diphosphate Delta-isomerase [Rhodospirillaceae bacterium]